MAFFKKVCFEKVTYSFFLKVPFSDRWLSTTRTRPFSITARVLRHGGRSEPACGSKTCRCASFPVSAPPPAPLRIGTCSAHKHSCMGECCHTHPPPPRTDSQTRPPDDERSPGNAVHKTPLVNFPPVALKWSDKVSGRVRQMRLESGRAARCGS